MNKCCLPLLWAFILIVVCVSPAIGEQLSKVAVLDLERVYASYPEDAEIFEAIDILRDTYEERIGLYTQLIEDIGREIEDAKDADDEIAAERLENERNEIVEDRSLYAEIMNRRIVDAYRQILAGEGIVQDVLAAIERVAIDEGYSLVLDADDSRLWWYSQEIVITDLVINRLRAIAR